MTAKQRRLARAEALLDRMAAAEKARRYVPLRKGRRVFIVVTNRFGDLVVARGRITGHYTRQRDDTRVRYYLRVQEPGTTNDILNRATSEVWTSYKRAQMNLVRTACEMIDKLTDAVRRNTPNPIVGESKRHGKQKT